MLSTSPQPTGTEFETLKDINPVLGSSQSGSGPIQLDVSEINSCADLPVGRLCVQVNPEGYRADFYRPKKSSRIYVDFNLICSNHSPIGDKGAFWVEPDQHRSYVFKTGHGVKPCAAKLWVTSCQS